ncbi:hypothetical protein D9M68_773700 [compost metagenome]
MPLVDIFEPLKHFLIGQAVRPGLNNLLSGFKQERADDGLERAISAYPLIRLVACVLLF